MKNVTTRHLRLFGSLNQTKLTPDFDQWASLMFSTATQIFKELDLLEQVRRIELPLTAWQAVVLTVILHLHGISIASAGSVRSKPVIYLSVREPTMESGAE